MQNPEKEICVSGHNRKKKRTLEELCASLPVEERIVDLPDDEKVNANGHALVCIGQEYIRTELVLERAKAKVVKHYRKVYADRELEQETGYSEVFKPVMPPRPDDTNTYPARSPSSGTPSSFLPALRIVLKVP